MNRILQAHDALAALLEAAFAGSGAKAFRNPDGARSWSATDFAVVLDDDDAPEVQGVVCGGIYDLKASPMVTLARKAPEPDRRAGQWDDVSTLRLALAQDHSLGGVVEDARIEGVESAELERATYVGGGLLVTVRLLFAAPSPAG